MPDHPKLEPAMLEYGADQVLVRSGDRWLYFHEPVRIVEAESIAEVAPALRSVNEAVDQRGLHAAGFLSYEAGAAFDPAFPVGDMSGVPLLWFGLYEKPHVLGDDRLPWVDLPDCDPSWSPTVEDERYLESIRAIRRYIAEGDTYQINYTYRLHAPMADAVECWPLFGTLVASQRAPMAAYVRTQRHAICSASPELFFQLDGQDIVSRPMKGTAPRGLTLEPDLRRAEQLRSSEKERAENVMIVDMVRNDLGRIAETGTVHVEDLLRVEKYPTVWQLTTAVHAKTLATLPEIMGAMFPAASITGTPKRRAMQIIDELETTPRGVYTGSIGYYAPGRKALFNVAIRTVVADLTRQELEYGVGGGIVWDSEPEAELRESHVKSRVLKVRVPRHFQLLETMRWTYEEGYVLLDEHLRRMRESAVYFDHPFDEAAIREKLATVEAGFDDAARRVRVLLDETGEWTVEAYHLGHAPAVRPRVCFAREPVDPRDPFLYHKTTHRGVYEHARKAYPDVDDVILWNELDDVTEATIANIVVEVDSQLFTPPVDAGLLAGTLRAKMLEEKQLAERRLSKDDIRRADRILLLNSVRGMYEVELIEE